MREVTTHPTGSKDLTLTRRQRLTGGGEEGITPHSGTAAFCVSGVRFQRSRVANTHQFVRRDHFTAKLAVLV
jgi:hypothetical protein